MFCNIFIEDFNDFSSCSISLTLGLVLMQKNSQSDMCDLEYFIHHEGLGT